MIWGDPWTQIATQKTAESGRFCTTLPPPRSQESLQFLDTRKPRKPKKPGKPNQEWLDLVRTRWTIEEAALRLTDAIIPCLYDGGALVATCVLRERRLDDTVWILETLNARKGWGARLLRAVISWLWYEKVGGPFIMAYTWELSLPALMSAWWRGWLRSAAEIQYGWALSLTDDCNFCPDHGWEPVGPRLPMPTYFPGPDGFAAVSDSGLVDGWGHVLAFRGRPDWSRVGQKGGWRRLWMRSRVSPGPGWSWTGEFVVVGFLNYNGLSVPLEWITAEI
jgi:hypothetical protein